MANDEGNVADLPANVWHLSLTDDEDKHEGPIAGCPACLVPSSERPRNAPPEGVISLSFQSDPYEIAVRDPRTGLNVGLGKYLADMEARILAAIVREQPWTPLNEHKEALMEAWGVIANVAGGDLTTQTPEWQAAAKRWHNDVFLPLLAAKEPT